ncbi:MAG: DUF1194 domain-containing protein [Hyphomicrobiaceae bacterium]|nr:MAG: DUF1194 domain-containing protein [Hyphomicrobiaceae bacterium]
MKGFRSAALCVLPCLALVGGPAFLPPAASAQAPVDLELVIAVDVSLSMDIDEQRVQRDGYVAAFRDREIHRAITSGAHGRIAVIYMEWAGPPSQSVVVPWTIIDGPDAARGFADRLERAPISRMRMTSISSALSYSKGLFETSGVKGVRRVVDVSGDGPNNSGPTVMYIRDDLLASGIVINGLPIMLKEAASMSMFDIRDLDRYYMDCVIGGPGSFVVPVRTVDEFRTAIHRKLLLEIAGREAPPPARIIRVQGAAREEAADCMVGERQWRRYLEGVPN